MSEKSKKDEVKIELSEKIKDLKFYFSEVLQQENRLLKRAQELT